MSKSTETTAGTTDSTDFEAFLDQFRDPERRTIQADENPRATITDEQSIRNFYGVKPWDRDRFDYPNLLPDVIEKTWNPDPGETGGGTDLLTVGKPGSGKSTFANHLAVREIGVSESKVVWRGSPSRSEWLPLAPWTTLCLPEGVDYTAEFVTRDPNAKTYELTLDQLQEHVVRDVKRYSSPYNLNHGVLEPGQVHVVYPDPRMRGVQRVYEAADEKQYDPPSEERELFDREDPSTHWWFGWVLSRVEEGPHDWTTLILDEIGDIAPEAARNDQFGTYQKIQLLRDSWVDARKKGLSIYAFGHAERDIHNLIRHKIRWRMYMNGTSNPTSKNEVVGFGGVPMRHDLTSSMDIGEGMIFNQVNFDPISWPDYPAPANHKLKLEAGDGA